MTDKEWKDWHVVKEEQEEDERRLMRNPGELEDVGTWTKLVLTLITSPFIALYIAYKISYFVTYPVVWLAIGVIFDPWKHFAKPLAMIISVGITIGIILSVLTVIANPQIASDMISQLLAVSLESKAGN